LSQDKNLLSPYSILGKKKGTKILSKRRIMGLLGNI